MEILLSMAATMRAREVLRFDYAPRIAPVDDSFRPPRRVEPHHLVTAHGRWYLVAWDLERDDWRVFSAERITPRVPTSPRFTPREVPGGDVHEFVSARFRGSDVNQWPCVGTVILDLPVDEVLPFAGDGTVRPYGDGRCTLESGSWSWGALAASYGRFEVAMEVLEPTELSEAFAALAHRYRDTATQGPGP